MGLLNHYLGSAENVIINFSMGKACDAAWLFAETLSPLSEVQCQKATLEKDEVIAMFSNVISHLGFVCLQNSEFLHMLIDGLA